MKTFIHLLRYRLGLDSAHTQTSALERKCIVELARGRTRVVEIGVYEGVTTGQLASVLPPHAILYAVDPFLSGRLGICWGKSIAKTESRKFKPSCRIQFVECFSHQAVQRIEGMFDFIFIDGDHTWNGIEQDWHDWAPRIEIGGLVALHDTLVSNHNPAVANLGSHQFFMQHIRHDQRFRIVRQVDSLSVLERIPDDRPLCNVTPRLPGNQLGDADLPARHSQD